MKLTNYGHSCFEVEVKGKKILFDPFITHNELAKDIDVNSILTDYILLYRLLLKPLKFKIYH